MAELVCASPKTIGVMENIKENTELINEAYRLTIVILERIIGPNNIKTSENLVDNQTPKCILDDIQNQQIYLRGTIGLLCQIQDSL